jgi:hypothetical protein
MMAKVSSIGTRENSPLAFVKGQYHCLVCPRLAPLVTRQTSVIGIVDKTSGRFTWK